MIQPPAAPAQRTAAHDSDRVLERVESAIARIGAIAGAAAGTVVFVAVVGGAVMWLRFRNAGLPADHAVALVPRADLVVVGLRLMVLPVAAAGLLSAGYLWWQRPKVEELDRLAHRERALRRALDELDEDDSDEPSSWRVVLAERLAGTEVEQQAVRRGEGVGHRLPAPVRSRFATVLGALVIGVLLVCVPFTPSALVWPLAAMVLLRYHRRLCRTCAQVQDRAGPSHLPRWRLAVAAMIIAACISVARQLDPPVQLPSVQVDTGEHVLDGTLVTANREIVAMAPTGSRSIRVLPRSSVEGLLVGPPGDRRAPGRSLLSHALAGRAWAATPLDVWCGGEHYPWWRLGDVCETQPYVAGGVRVAARSVVAVVVCPRAARDGCAGFVAVTTRRAFTSDDAAQRVILGRAPFSVRGGTRGALRVPISGKGRRIVASAQGRQVAALVSLSRDLAGDAPVPGSRLAATLRLPPPGPAVQGRTQARADGRGTERRPTGRRLPVPSPRDAEREPASLVPESTAAPSEPSVDPAAVPPAADQAIEAQ